MSHDLGQGYKAELVKLPGRKSGYAAKIIKGQRHVATISDPDDDSREGVLMQCRMWMIMYKEAF